MNKYFYFFDLNEVLIDRYPAKIAKYLQENDHTNNFIFIYCEKYRNSEPENMPEGSQSFYIPDLSLSKIDELVLKYPPVSLTTIAQRIPDMLMLSIFNKRKFPTFIVQHGLFSDKLERISLLQLFLSKLPKFIKYIKYTISLCRINKIPIIPTLLELYKFLLVENLNIPDTECLKDRNLRARKAFIFDKSWDDYYLKKYGYGEADLIYIGNPDFLILKEKDLSNKEDAVCYICQSLVEDGRYLLEDYEEFLKILKNYVASEKKLYIKLHPRSRREYYNIIESEKNIIFTSDFPICEYYIAHYTGMLATAKQCSDNVLIWKLKDHHMPQYFYQFASIVTDNVVELKEFIEGKSQKHDKKLHKKLSNEELMNFNPVKVIADNLYNFSIK